MKEIMEIQAGELNVLLPGSSEWITISGQGEFTVPANAKFKLKVKTVSDYICSYINERKPEMDKEQGCPSFCRLRDGPVFYYKTALNPEILSHAINFCIK